jgi:hypothetical protein
VSRPPPGRRPMTDQLPLFETAEARSERQRIVAKLLAFLDSLYPPEKRTPRHIRQSVNKRRPPEEAI